MWAWIIVLLFRACFGQLQEAPKLQEVPEYYGFEDILTMFSGFAESYDNTVLNHYGYTAYSVVPAWIVAVLDAAPADTSLPQLILDAGCGTGLSSTVFFNRTDTFRVTGVDVSFNMLEKAKVFPYYKLLHQSLETPLEPLHYHAAVMIGVIEFMQDPYPSLKVIYDSLRIGGYLALTYPINRPEIVTDGLRIVYFNQADMRGKLEKLGFTLLKLTEMKGYQFGSTLVHYEAILCQKGHKTLR